MYSWHQHLGTLVFLSDSLESCRKLETHVYKSDTCLFLSETPAWLRFLSNISVFLSATYGYSCFQIGYLLIPVRNTWVLVFPFRYLCIPVRNTWLLCTYSSVILHARNTRKIFLIVLSWLFVWGLSLPIDIVDEYICTFRVTLPYICYAPKHKLQILDFNARIKLRRSHIR